MTLNLTPQKKDELLKYLENLTPEQQQQQITHFLKEQQKQKMAAQVRAQVKLQQQQHQQRQGQTGVGQTGVAQGNTTSTGPAILPVTVQAAMQVKLISTKIYTFQVKIRTSELLVSH